MNRLWVLVLLCGFVACKGELSNTEAGIIVRTDQGVQVRVEVVTPTIARVTATCDKRFSERESLAVLPKSEEVDFSIDSSSEECVRLTTSAMQIAVDRTSGRVQFFDAAGEPILEEDRREFSPIEVEGDRGYTVRQVFHSPDDEAFYGLGQHQSDEFNYKGGVLSQEINSTRFPDSDEE